MAVPSAVVFSVPAGAQHERGRPDEHQNPADTGDKTLVEPITVVAAGESGIVSMRLRPPV